MNPMRTTEFSIIIPWRSGDPDRENCLKHTLNAIATQDIVQELEDIHYEIIVVEHVINQYASSRTRALIQQIENLKYVSLSSEKAFNKSWCMNVGARHARYPNLLFVDADILFGNLYLRTIRDYALGLLYMKNKALKRNLMICWNYHVCLIGKDNPVIRYNRPDSARMLGGVWYCDAAYYFNKFGGMNENFFGYGGEDNEAYERAQFVLGGPIPEIPYPIIHQYHDWAQPDPRAGELFNKVKYNPGTVLERLKSSNSGQIDRPTLIKMDDLGGISE